MLFRRFRRFQRDARYFNRCGSVIAAVQGFISLVGAVLYAPFKERAAHLIYKYLLFCRQPLKIVFIVPFFLFFGEMTEPRPLLLYL